MNMSVKTLIVYLKELAQTLRILLQPVKISNMKPISLHQPPGNILHLLRHLLVGGHPVLYPVTLLLEAQLLH